MLDTMVFDAVADGTPEALAALDRAVRDGELALFTTTVQEAQLAAVPDPVRRKALRRLSREVLPPEDPGDVLDRHRADAVIAATAAARCDVLVTEDRWLTEHAAGRGLTVWPVARLLGQRSGGR